MRNHKILYEKIEDNDHPIKLNSGEIIFSIFLSIRLYYE
jgi:hypothetical protein